MTTEARSDAWGAGESYERYMGRWSRLVARSFIVWIGPEPGLTWLDVGCGTGALTGAVLQHCAPGRVIAMEPSPGFIRRARDTTPAANVGWVRADAAALPCAGGACDLVVAGLAFNFFPDRNGALQEMRRVAKAGGTVAIYVWDYPGVGVGFMKAFWEAAVELDPAARDEGPRFDFCVPESLAREFTHAGFADVQVGSIEIESVFADFEDFWLPFTLGAGPAPAYYASLAPAQQEALRHGLETRFGARGRLAFPARAWTVRGRNP